ncbi:unnamed protein product [Lupinus luteus]|uniref:Uncharacterized protein n=1 Tax=Lupinus luteus TaxID=3873 RepID=A0AAV1XEH1_LUPLU
MLHLLSALKILHYACIDFRDHLNFMLHLSLTLEILQQLYLELDPSSSLLEAASSSHSSELLKV